MVLDDQGIQQIANIHKMELKGDCFLSECSKKFIYLFYKNVVRYESTIFYTYKERENEIKGYIFCTTDKNEYFKRFLKKNKFALILYPSIYIPLLKRITLRGMISESQSSDDLQYDAEVVYFAVKNIYQRRGIGRKLICLVEQELKKRGINNYYLQIYSDNIKALKFYESVGFTIIHDLTSNGRDKYLMHKNID